MEGEVPHHVGEGCAFTWRELKKRGPDGGTERSADLKTKGVNWYLWETQWDPLRRVYHF